MHSAPISVKPFFQGGGKPQGDRKGRPYYTRIAHPAGIVGALLAYAQ